MLATPPELAVHFSSVGPRLEPVFAVRTRGYYSREHSPFLQVTTEALASLDDEERRAAVAYLFDVALQRNSNRVFRQNAENAGGWILSILGRRKLSWTVEQLAWLARFVRVRHRQLDEDGRSRTLSLLITGLERSSGDLLPLADDLRWLEAHMTDPANTERGRFEWYGWYDDPKIKKYASRLHTVIGSGGPATLPDRVLDGKDTFGPRARTAMLAVVDEATAAELIVVLQAYGSGPRPPARWRTQVTAALETGGLLVAARALLETARSQSDPPNPDHIWFEHWIHPDSQAFIRAALWAVSIADPSDAFTSELRDLGAHVAQSAGTRGLSTRSISVANAVIAALTERLADPASPGALVSALLAIRQRAANRALTYTIDKTLESIAAASGVTAAELAEHAVPTYGLDADGQLSRRLGDHLGIVRASVTGGRCDTTLSWTTAAGRSLSGVPAAVRRDHAEELGDLRRLVKDIRKALPPQRDRLDQLMAAQRTWDPVSWHQDYVDHPVVGLFARRLIWQFDAEAGLPESLNDGSWGLRTVDGRLLRHTADTVVTLWHPLGQPLAEITAWRDHLTRHEIRQPFKQAFREIYLLTPAEEQTATHSNRFASHVLRYRQAAALMRAREWRTPALGEWDLGDEGEAVRSFGALRVCFAVDLVDQGEYEAEYCATGQVRFETDTPDGAGRVVPLAEVDPLVFSEAMRDVDLFVGVASIGADARWLETTGHRHRDYWQEFSFGEPSASAALRREALERIIPRTKLRDRARVDQRFLIVEGRLRTYKIHLGSSNILMSPNDTYLCIVAKPTLDSQPVYLPFEEDGRLSVILSKAFLLAEDNTITDPEIVRQFGR
ncbi:MAG: DUF4132 domain-containing protein [Propionibacteriaceae bacterium]